MHLCDLALTTVSNTVRNTLILLGLTPQSVMLGLSSDNVNHYQPNKNHVLLIFKLHVYNAREKHGLNTLDVLCDKKEIIKTEYRLSFNSVNKKKIY